MSLKSFFPTCNPFILFRIRSEYLRVQGKYQPLPNYMWPAVHIQQKVIEKVFCVTDWKGSVVA